MHIQATELVSFSLILGIHGLIPEITLTVLPLDPRLVWLKFEIFSDKVFL